MAEIRLLYATVFKRNPITAWHNHGPRYIKRHLPYRQTTMYCDPPYSQNLSNRFYSSISLTWLFCRGPVVNPVSVVIFSEDTADARRHRSDGLNFLPHYHLRRAPCEWLMWQSSRSLNTSYIHFIVCAPPTPNAHTHTHPFFSITTEGWHVRQRHRSSADTNRSALKWHCWPPHLL